MKRIICIFLCLFAISVSQAYAMEAAFDRDTQTVEISGTAGKNERIAIIVTDENISKLDGTSVSSLEEHSIGFYEAYADENGDYSLSFRATRSEGQYNFFASGKSTKDKAKEELYKKTTLDSALTKLSEAAAQGSTRILEVLEDEQFRKVIGLNELYDRISDKSILANAIAQNSSYGSYRELNSVTESIRVMQNFCDRFNAMVNNAQVKDLVKELQGFYRGDEAVYTKYFGLKSTDSIDEAIFGKKPYRSISAIYNAFAAATDEYKEKPVYYGGSGGSGGSGGGGGGRSGAVIPSGGISANENPSVKANANGANNTNNAVNTNNAQTFIDVAPDHWGYDAIEALYKMEIIDGISSNEFAPERVVKREEFVKMCVSLTGLEISDQQDTFTDTDKSDWYSPYLAIAQECGLVFGRDDGSFGIGEVLTREDMAVLAARVLGSTERGIGEEFSDEHEISDYAKNSVAILCGLKVMNGMGDGRFAPKETATRAQAAKVIYEIAKLME